MQYFDVAGAVITQSSFVDSSAAPRPKYDCVSGRPPSMPYHLLGGTKGLYQGGGIFDSFINVSIMSHVLVVD